MSNEQLCTAALDGDTEARNALVENNLRFIKRPAYEMWSAQQELNAALGIEINDSIYIHLRFNDIQVFFF